MHLATQRITWLVCYFKTNIILQDKKTGSWLRTQRYFTALWWSSSNIIIWIEVITWLDKCPRLCQFNRLIAAVVWQNCFKLSNTVRLACYKLQAALCKRRTSSFNANWLRIYALLITVVRSPWASAVVYYIHSCDASTKVKLLSITNR